MFRIAEGCMVRKRLGTPVLDKAVSRTAQTKLSDFFCKNVMQYCTTVWSALHANTTASDFNEFVFVLSYQSIRENTIQ